MTQWNDSVRLWIETCCKCGCRFGMADSIHAAALQRREQYTFFCPNGHGQHYTSSETEADKLRRERDMLKQQQARLVDELRQIGAERDHEKRRAAAWKGQTTKIKRRVQHGVCPCCNRTFADLAAHMANKHPDFAQDHEFVHD